MARAAGTTWITGFVLAACAALAPVPALAGADLNKAAITKWLEGRLAEGRGEWYLPGLRVDYVVELPSQLTKAAADELAEAVRGKPDHPRIAELQQYVWEQSHGATRLRCSLWMQEDGLWRRNNDQATVNGASFVDEGRAGSSVWTLTADQINVRSATGGDGGTPPAIERVQGASESLRRLWFSGLSAAATTAARVLAVQLEGHSWTARIEFEGLPNLAVKGGQFEGQPVVEVVRIEQAANPAWVGVRWAFSTWMREGGTGRVLPTVCEEWSANGALRSRISAVAFTPVSRAEVAALAAVPDAKRPDPVRGELKTVRTVNDWRPERKESARMLADGTVRTLPLGDAASVHRGWQWFGWVIGSVTMVVFFCRWIARRAAGSV